MHSSCQADDCRGGESRLLDTWLRDISRRAPPVTLRQREPSASFGTSVETYWLRFGVLDVAARAPRELASQDGLTVFARSAGGHES
jgi:hypothetical protein